MVIQFVDLSGIAGLFALLLLVLFISTFVLYVIGAIGLYSIAKREGYDKPWLAWIPLGNGCLMMLLNEYDVLDILVERFTLTFVISTLASVAFVGIIPFISVIPFVCMYYAFYLIADRYSERPVLHLLLALVTMGASMSVSYFLFRHRESLYE